MKKNKRKKKPLIIIPVRMGSKRLKFKNILPIKKKPMFVYVAKKILKSEFSPIIYISSESRRVKKICNLYNLNFIKRPKKLSSDKAEKQLSIVHEVKALTKKKLSYKPEIVISLQANSPEVNAVILDKAIKLFKKSFIKKKNKELITVDENNLQNAAFRIMTYSAVFQKSLSTNIIVFKKNYTDIHTKKDYLKVLKKYK